MSFHSTPGARRAPSRFVVASTFCVAAATAFVGDHISPHVWVKGARVRESAEESFARRMARPRRPDDRTFAYLRGRAQFDGRERGLPMFDLTAFIPGVTEGSPEPPRLRLRVVDTSGAPVRALKTRTLLAPTRFDRLGGVPLDSFPYPFESRTLVGRRLERSSIAVLADADGRVVVPGPPIGGATVVASPGYVETAVVPPAESTAGAADARDEIVVVMHKGAAVDVGLSPLPARIGEHRSPPSVICAYRRIVQPLDAETARFADGASVFVSDVYEPSTRRIYAPPGTEVLVEYRDCDGFYAERRVVARDRGGPDVIEAPPTPPRTSVTVRASFGKRRRTIHCTRVATPGCAAFFAAESIRDDVYSFDVRSGPVEIRIGESGASDHATFGFKRTVLAEGASRHFDVEPPSVREVNVITKLPVAGCRRGLSWSVRLDDETHLTSSFEPCSSPTGFVAFVPAGRASKLVVRYAGDDHVVDVPHAATTVVFEPPPVGRVVLKPPEPIGLLGACEWMLARSDGGSVVSQLERHFESVNSPPFDSIPLTPGFYVGWFKTSFVFHRWSSGSISFFASEWDSRLEEVVDRASVRLFGPVHFEVRTGESTTVKFGD